MPVTEFSNPSGTITLLSDGIYILTITTTTGIPPEEVTTVNKFVIFDFCNLFDCVKKLLLEVWCKEDICCDGCDEKKDSKKRHELNKIMAAFQSLIAITYAQSFTYFGLTCISDARMKKVKEVNALYKTLKKLVENCGACKDTVSENTIPCKFC